MSPGRTAPRVPVPPPGAQGQRSRSASRLAQRLRGISPSRAAHPPERPTHPSGPPIRSARPEWARRSPAFVGWDW